MVLPNLADTEDDFCNQKSSLLNDFVLKIDRQYRYIIGPASEQ